MEDQVVITTTEESTAPVNVRMTRTRKEIAIGLVILFVVGALSNFAAIKLAQKFS